MREIALDIHVVITVHPVKWNGRHEGWKMHSGVRSIELSCLERFEAAADVEVEDLYYLEFVRGDFVSPSTGRRLEVDYQEARGAPLSEKLRAATRYSTIFQHERLLYIPVLRNQDCVAIVSAGRNRVAPAGDSSGCAGEQSMSLIASHREAILSDLCHAFTHRFLLNVVQGLREPISYTELSEREFFSRLAAGVSKSLGMSKCCIRRLEMAGCLRAAGKYGFPETELSKLDFPPNHMPRPFLVALEERKSNVVEEAKRVPEIRDDPTFSDVNSFVVSPVHVSGDLFGTLSVGTPVPFSFSEEEVEAIRTTCNAAEIAIANFEHYRASLQQVEELADTAASISAVEVAQAVRHETVGYIGHASSKLALVKRRAGARDARLISDLNEIESALGLTGQAIEKIRLATRPPKTKLREVSVSALWGSTCELLKAGRLEPGKISARYEGKDVVLRCYPDWLRAAFLNLVLNSYDAYMSGAASGKREIVLSNKANSGSGVTLEYRDNAGGIEVHKLKYPPRINKENYAGHGAGYLNTVLFEPNVSSKGENGSGYGLYLVRRGIQIHPGSSIDITRYRGGVTFEINIVPIREEK